MDSYETLYYWTQVSLDSIWREIVLQCIEQHEAENTGQTIDEDTSEWEIVEQHEAEYTGQTIDEDTSEWEILEHTIISEPYWGITVNRN
jgi:hypothetical protein